MNRLEIRVVRGGESEDEVRFLIDGADLVDLVRLVEAPHAEREGHPSLAGAYAGLSAGVILPPSRHLFGEDDVLGADEDGNVTLAGCDCGEPGCWPLRAKVTIANCRVVWSDFRQPHRGPSAIGGEWTYAGCGPFTFGIDEYEFALNHPSHVIVPVK